MFASLFRRLRHRGPAEIAGLFAKNLRHLLRAFTPQARAARAADLAFDRRWGTDTSRGLSTRELGYNADRLGQYRRYDPSSEAMLHDPVRALALDPADHDFIDYGAGKGRVLMLAMAMGFRTVTGVELSAHLCAIAKANLDRFTAQNTGLKPAAILNGDATAHRPSGRAILAYFYNPFDAAIMTQVRRRLEGTLEQGTASVTVIYANPEHAEVFQDAPGWQPGPAFPGIATFHLTA